MITEEQRIQLKKNLKRGYLKDVKKILDKKRIKNTRGNFYSTNSIQQVMNGKRENLKIEDAIFKVYENHKEENLLEEEKRKKLIEQRNQLLQAS